MKNSKSNLDEMQEMKLLGIEHTVCYICLYGLLAAIFGQVAMGHGDFSSIGGECILLLIAGVYLSVSCMKNGIWDRKLKPDLKTHVVVSVVTGLLAGVFWFAVSYHHYHKLVGSAALFLLMTMVTMVATLALLSLVTAIYKRRIQQMEVQQDKEELEE